MLAAVRAAGRDDCTSWAGWFERIARPVRWDHASEVARDKSADWSTSEFSSTETAQRSAEGLVSGSGNANAGEVRSSLDLLCALAQHLTRAAYGDTLD